MEKFFVGYPLWSSVLKDDVAIYPDAHTADANAFDWEQVEAADETAAKQAFLDKQKGASKKGASCGC